MECEVFLLMLIKTIEAPADGPAWPRILALEMFRKFSADMNVVMYVSFYTAWRSSYKLC